MQASLFGVADLGYEGLNMQVRETSIYKTSGFSSYFFHTLIKQRRLFMHLSIEFNFDPGIPQQASSHL